jgi:Flp pilus assembly pilin Flp
LNLVFTIFLQNGGRVCANPLAIRSKGANMMKIKAMKRVWADDSGQDVAEYAVMLAVILVIVVGTVRLIGGHANNVFSAVGTQMGQ